VALSPLSPLSHVLPCFPILILSSLHLVIFRHPYLTRILEIFNTMNSALHLLHIYRFDFHLKKKNLHSNCEKILQSNKFLKVLPSRNDFFMKIKMIFASYETLDFES
jgi:hypothetical protein